MVDNEEGTNSKSNVRSKSTMTKRKMGDIIQIEYLTEITDPEELKSCLRKKCYKVK